MPTPPPLDGAPSLVVVLFDPFYFRTFLSKNADRPVGFAIIPPVSKFTDSDAPQFHYPSPCKSCLVTPPRESIGFRGCGGEARKIAPIKTSQF